MYSMAQSTTEMRADIDLPDVMNLRTCITACLPLRNRDFTREPPGGMHLAIPTVEKQGSSWPPISANFKAQSVLNFDGETIMIENIVSETRHIQLLIIMFSKSRE
jgi:hypothetical protein